MTSALGWKSEYLSPRRQEREGWKKRDYVLRLFSLGDLCAFARDLRDSDNRPFQVLEKRR
jgi:hypothetical protein